MGTRMGLRKSVSRYLDWDGKTVTDFPSQPRSVIAVLTLPISLVSKTHDRLSRGSWV